MNRLKDLNTRSQCFTNRSRLVLRCVRIYRWLQFARLRCRFRSNCRLSDRLWKGSKRCSDECVRRLLLMSNVVLVDVVHCYRRGGVWNVFDKERIWKGPVVWARCSVLNKDQRRTASQFAVKMRWLSSSRSANTAPRTSSTSHKPE